MAGSFQVLSLNGPKLELREHKKRRPHKKTKSGCLSCKVKKVKCDQAQPVCLRCQRNGLPCSYSQSVAKPFISASSPSIPLTLELTIFTQSDPSRGTAPQALFHHFHSNCDTIFVLPHIGIAWEPISDLAKTRPYLLNVLLAISASHLRNHAPDPGSHRLAEHFQQSLALRDFSANISKPLSSHVPEEIDILLVAASLLNMVSFILPAEEDPSPETTEPDPSRSWVFSTRPGRLDWLAIQLGIRDLLIASIPFRFETWKNDPEHGPAIRQAEACSTARARKPAAEQLWHRVPDAWLGVFEISRTSVKDWRRRSLFVPGGATSGTIEHRSAEEISAMLEDAKTRENLFCEPLLLLAELRDLEPSMGNVFHYLQFLQKLDPNFRHLLYDKDERALWMFGCWLGLMCRFDYIWWISRRTRRDFKAIVIWLQSRGVTERHGGKGMLWSELMKDLEGMEHRQDGAVVTSEDSAPSVRFHCASSANCDSTGHYASPLNMSINTYHDISNIGSRKNTKDREPVILPHVRRCAQVHDSPITH